MASSFLLEEMILVWVWHWHGSALFFLLWLLSLEVSKVNQLIQLDESQSCHRGCRGKWEGYRWEEECTEPSPCSISHLFSQLRLMTCCQPDVCCSSVLWPSVPDFTLRFWASLRKTWLTQKNTSWFCVFTNCSWWVGPALPCCKSAQCLHKLEIEVKHGTCVWVLNSLALEAVQMRLKNRFHVNPKAQACSCYPVAYQQHFYSLEDIFILRVDLLKVYYTFSRVENAFISVTLWKACCVFFFFPSISPLSLSLG